MLACSNLAVSEFVNRFLKENYKNLQPLFSLDCLLVFNVAYICPKSDIADLCDNIHLPYAVFAVSKKLEKINKLETSGEIEASCTLQYASRNILCDVHLYTCWYMYRLMMLSVNHWLFFKKE